jgi:hypothetical protein
VGLKVAVCGLWSETRDLIPWDDPSWEKWGMTWDRDVLRMDRAFEMHATVKWKEYAPADYIERLQMMPRLYLQEPHPDVPRGVVYPFDEVGAITGDDWASSIGYMLALAIYEGAEEILIAGVTMEAHDEYAYQRPNTTYLIGLARGRGIKVHIPEQSSLCKYRGELGYTGRYGRIEEKK